jgi:hypothetical protein
MRPGFAFRLKIAGQSVGVVYTTHFAERYHNDSKDRPAVKMFASEQFVQNAIKEGIPEIAGYANRKYKNLSGLIRSKSKKVNFVFEVIPKKDGFTLVMTSMMYKLNFIPLSLKDYVIEVNPKFNVHFQTGLDADLKAAVLDHLMGVIRKLERKAAYTLGDENVKYMIEIEKGDVYVDEAGWINDMLMVDVK